ncbi:MAG: hypothetical protein CMB52_05565 [Euryarchaeota archaeon]|nr:hypothetical protein [Euryarchaeota archaeon]MBJ84965.1 hypothetical protein [Euryarchaeota archaeon]|tara:strand:- start:1056 stop:1262 length:207 start_codon:yes stop_codon:yes gene_type:complete
MVKKGDIVNFYTIMRTWEKDYRDRNPGIVVASQEPRGGYFDKGHAYILWANGDMTREHMTYLKVVPDE